MQQQIDSLLYKNQNKTSQSEEINTNSTNNTNSDVTTTTTTTTTNTPNEINQINSEKNSNDSQTRKRPGNSKTIRLPDYIFDYAERLRKEKKVICTNYFT